MTVRKKKHSEWTRGSLLILAMLGMCSQIPAAKQHFGGRKEVINSQIEQDILAAIERNAQAKSAKEWQDSGYTPAEIFRSIHALKSQTAWKSACRTLTKLPVEQLALFEPELDQPKNAQSLPCHPELAAKLHSHWDQTHERLMAAYPAAYQTHGKARVPAAPNTSRQKTVNAHLTSEITKEFIHDGEVTLLFDGGPAGAGRTLRVLEALKEAGVRAMFVLPGEQIRNNGMIAQKVAQSGHVLSSTTLHPSDLTLLTVKSAEEEIRQGRSALSGVTGSPARFFRFPYESSNEALRRMVEKQGLLVLSPTLDSEDWRIRDPQALLKTIVAKLDQSRGGILELHDSNEQTVQLLPALLAEIKSRRFSTVVFVPSDSGATVAER